MHAHIDITGKNVLIIGCPASGKTYVADALKRDNPKHKLFHTDAYKQYGYVEALYVLIDELKELGTKKNTIVEGVQGYRLLRKGVELNCYYPDIVVELKISDALMRRTYERERDPEKIRYLKGFNASHQKILNDYKAMAIPAGKKPQWIELQNSY